MSTVPQAQSESPSPTPAPAVRHSTREQRAKRRRVKPANRAELERLQAEQLQEQAEDAVEAQAQPHWDGAGVATPPAELEPMDPEKKRATISRYVRFLTCAGNLIAARALGYLPLDRDDYTQTHQAATAELVDLVPDNWVRPIIVRGGSFIAGVLAKHLELVVPLPRAEEAPQ